MNKVNAIICALTFASLVQFNSFADTTYVNVINNQFIPDNFTIDVGDYIKWTLVEGTHTTSSDSIPLGASAWNYTFSGIGDSFIYQVTKCGDYTYECLFHAGMTGSFFAQDTFSVTLVNGWNLVSVPGIHPGGMGVDIWWFFRDPGASVFKFFNGSYTLVTTTEPGIGYWVKHIGTNTYNSCDEWPCCIQAVPNDPIPIHTGWNLISVYECPVSAGSLTTSPPALINAPVFGYSGTYFVADTLYPGYAYWLKSASNGWLNLPGCP